jgi:replicative DNA helicase
MAEEKLPPHSTEAERGLIGCMLRDNSAIDDVVQLIQKDHCYNDWAQRIFQVVIDLHEDGTPVDLISLHDELKARKWVEDVGGYAFLAELWDAAPTTNAELYARIVRRTAFERDYILTLKDGLRDAEAARGDLQSLLATTEKKLFDLAEVLVVDQSHSLAEVMDETLAWANRRKKNSEEDAVLTGFIDLDDLTGGLHHGELTLLAARPSTGKTALGLAIAKNVASKGHPVFFVSLEQPRVELGGRLICTETKIDGLRVRTGTMNRDQVEDFIAGADRLRTLPIMINDVPNQKVLQVAATARQLHRRSKVRLVVVDYLQLIDADGRRENRQEQIATISRRLKLLARELNIPVLALAQLNREVEGRSEQRPRLSDLRDSGALEQDADCVFMLWRPEGKESNIVELVIAKQRNGPLGEVTLTFDRQSTRFDNYAPPCGIRPF